MTADAILDKIQTLQKESAKTLNELTRSLAIKKLWPEAFKHGPVTSRVEGCCVKGFKFRVKNGAGEIKLFDIEDLPTPLLGPAVSSILKDTP